MLMLVFLLYSLAMLCMSHAYKILVVFPQPGKSHSILGFGVVKHLLTAGHDVTYITPFIENNTHPKLHQVDVSSNINVFPKEVLNFEALIDKSFELDYHSLWRIINLFQVHTLENQNVQKLLRDPGQQFDVVIVEWRCASISASYAAVFNAPLIWVGSTEPHWQMLRLIDEDPNPAYNGEIMMGNVPPFSFLQRVVELWTRIKIKYIWYSDIDDAERADYKRLIAPIIKQRGRHPPVYDEVKYNGSLILGNSHVSIGQASRIPQNYKPIAGYHIETNVEPLPQDLQNIFDNSQYGVIYFSLGSILESRDLPIQLKKDLLKMFSRLKETVLWKNECEEKEDFHDLPKNVHVVKWAPQQSILSHPKCRIFITHSGLLSTTEAVHFGIPIIGIPVFGDQFGNVNRAVIKGFAKRVDLSYNMAVDLEAAIKELLIDPKYRKKVKELSLIYHDRPVHPAVEVVHWVEHVVRTRGALHLQSPALLVPWYQKMYLDLAILFILALALVILLLKQIFVLIFPSKITLEGKHSNKRKIKNH